MVGWYDPGQLMATGAEVVVSTILARHIDSRRLDSAPVSDGPFDYRGSSESGLWIDYVADCGDGWDSTYAVAEAMCRNSIAAPRGAVNLRDLPRAEVLLFGGDLIYPTPSLEAYDLRLVAPYDMAAQVHGHSAGDVFAIPGNHDWYDSLVGFRRLFFNDRKFAAWQTKQHRSYFALKLPEPWWLFAVDIQLDHDIDEVQLDYFAKIAADFDESSRVVLCVAEPYWIHRETAAESEQPHTPRLLETLEQDILGDSLHVAIAGDLHHYRRHSTPEYRHQITCGTGGAFLHPTHDLDTKPLRGGFEHKCSFPDESVSRHQTYRNLFFLFQNPKFGFLTALIYLLVAWANGIHVGESFNHVEIAEMGELGIGEIGQAATAAIHSAILSPMGSALYMVLFLGFWFFTDRTSKAFRLLGGTIHAMAHIVLGFFIYWLGARLAIHHFGMPPKSIEQYLTTGAVIFVLAWLGGSVLFGVYLLVALNVFGKHPNEAFSSLGVPDWKGFLRMHIAADGDLTIYFVGLRRVPRRWRWDQASDGLVSDDPRSSEPEVVDVAYVPRQ